MNKKLSRIAAIALSAAMVTSAFAMSTSSAFAATTPTITPKAITYNAVYDASLVSGATNNNKVSLTTVFGTPKATVKAGNDSNDDVTLALNGTPSYTITGGSNLAKIDSGNLVINQTGTVTITAKAHINTAIELETGKHGGYDTYDSNTNNITVTAKVAVYKSGAAFVLPVPTTAYDAKSELPTSEKVGMNEDATFNVYTVSPTGAGDVSAKFEGLTTTHLATDYVSGNASNFPITANTTNGVATFTAATADKVKTGSTTISYTPKINAETAKAFTLTVSDYYVVGTGDTMAVTSQYGKASKTVMNKGGSATAATSYDVTGKDLHVGADNLTVTGEGANVGAITADGAGNVTVNAGTVKSISATGAGTVTIKPAADMGNVVVGDVTSKESNVTVNGANSTVDSNKNTDGTFSSVKVGNISITDKAALTAGAANTTIALTSMQDPSTKAAEGLVNVGNITTNGNVTVETSADAKTLTTGTISGVQGNYADCPYTATFTLKEGTFTTGDLKNIGAVTVTAGKLTTGAINTGVVGAASDAHGCKTVSTGKVTVTAGDLNATSINTTVLPEGSGNVTVPANSFTIANDSATDASTGLTLYVKDLKQGTVLYTTAKKAANLFKIPGVVSVEGQGNNTNVYTYTAKEVEFLGFTVDQKNVEVGKGASTTLTTTTTPNMALPTGVTISWAADKDTVKLTPSADGRTCAVTSTGYTAENVNGGNTVNITATMMKDGIAWSPFNSSLGVDTCQVTLTGETAPVLTTKVKNLNDTEAKAVTGDTVIKMTQSTYATVEFSADKAGIANINYITANDKVAQTGTASAWNGTAGTYNVYANGKVGDKVGVFANGVKVFQIEIVDRPFECDTTLDLDGVKAPALTVGQKYSFKIRKANPAIKDFTFLTANDSAVASWGFVKNADGTVTATIKALKATDKIGVYAKINGVTYKVFAAAVK